MKEERLLKSKMIEEALRAIPRELFFWQGTPEFLAYVDEPQSLGDTGQTISAPHMVVIMLEELELIPNLKILEVGCGSGYNAALLGWIVSNGMKSESKLVTSIERNERLAAFSKDNLSRVGLSKVVDVVVGDGSLGYPQSSTEELYDRITVTAGVARIPVCLKKQLKDQGILLAPVGGTFHQKLTKFHKIRQADGSVKYDEKRLTDCMFVPLIGEDSNWY